MIPSTCRRGHGLARGGATEEVRGGICAGLGECLCGRVPLGGGGGGRRTNKRNTQSQLDAAGRRHAGE